MNRGLQYLNLFGVAALAILCVAQWRANRPPSVELNLQQPQFHEQAAKWKQAESSLAGTRADFEDFRERLTQADARLRGSEAQAAATERQLRDHASERAALLASVTELLKYLAHEACNDRLLFVQEGGYNPDSLQASVLVTVDSLLHPASRRPGVVHSQRAAKILENHPLHAFWTV